MATRPGTIGFVLRDRVTGAKYRNANAATPIWTASTIKLAMVADLLTRERAGTVRLSEGDRRLMVAMLQRSDNAAADTLWARYGGTAQVFKRTSRGMGCRMCGPRLDLATCSRIGASRKPLPTTSTGW